VARGVEPDTLNPEAEDVAITPPTTKESEVGLGC